MSMKLLTIGYSGEQNARRVLIPIGPYQAMWPDATPQLVVVRPVDEAEYIAVTTVEEDNLVWVPSAVDCQYVGVGKCQVVFTDAENNVIGKSEIFVVQVNAAVGNGSETPPEPYEPWVNSILAAADITVENAAKTTADAADAERYAGAASDSATAAEQAKRAIEDMDVAGNTLEPDSPVTVTKTVDPETGAITLTFGIPQGEKGDPGTGITFHICTSEEYDPVTRIPTVANPEQNTFYLVPAEEPVSPDLFVEWIYTNNAWEQFGSATIDLSGYATIADTVLTTTLSRGRKAGTTVGENSFAFGQTIEASGKNSHAEGLSTVASGNCSHAEGNVSKAIGNYSHAEGQMAFANGSQSHAEGYTTEANGNRSHVEGSNTIANGHSQHVSGKYNVADSHTSWPEWVASTSYEVGDKVKVTTTVDNETTVTGYICKTANSDAEFTAAKWTKDTYMNFAEIIGNGTSSARSNARALGWDGNEYLAGDLYVHANSDSSGGNKVATADEVSEKADKANPVFTGTLSRGRKTGTGTGSGSFAFGNNVEASGSYSHAEGNKTSAIGQMSHAEGSNTQAIGDASHAQGFRTIANGASSSVAGKWNVSDSYDSWPEWTTNTEYVVGNKVKVTTASDVKGYICKTANQDSVFTDSKWIDQNGQMNYAEIVGNGTADDARSNAYALDWDGNGHFMGNVYVGANADSSGGTRLVSQTDYATDSVGGVVKLLPNNMSGIIMNALATPGAIAVIHPNAADIKAGTDVAKSLNVMNLHIATFYGLSKVAGVDLANETVTLGTYPATSQAAIKSMLGVQDGLEVVRLI